MTIVKIILRIFDDLKYRTIYSLQNRLQLIRIGRAGQIIKSPNANASNAFWLESSHFQTSFGLEIGSIGGISKDTPSATELMVLKLPFVYSQIWWRLNDKIIDAKMSSTQFKQITINISSLHNHACDNKKESSKLYMHEQRLDLI